MPDAIARILVHTKGELITHTMESAALKEAGAMERKSLGTLNDCEDLLNWDGQSGEGFQIGTL